MTIKTYLLRKRLILIWFVLSLTYLFLTNQGSPTLTAKEEILMGITFLSTLLIRFIISELYNLLEEAFEPSKKAGQS
jgi:hypothetical protein